MVQLKVQKEFSYGGEDYEPGDTGDFPSSVAEELMNKGYGVEPVGGEEANVEELDLKEDKGINVENMLPGGTFVSAEDVEEGDKVTVTGSGKVDDSFEQERLVLPVDFDGEERQVSLGPENIERVSEAHGMNSKNWIGKKLKVALIKKYKGLGQKGIIWKPAAGE